MISIRGLRPCYHTPSEKPQPEEITYRPRFHSRQTQWHPDEIETVRTMWAQHKSAGDIAAHLGRSRNSILGKVRRLELKREERA